MGQETGGSDMHPYPTWKTTRFQPVVSLVLLLLSACATHESIRPVPRAENSPLSLVAGEQTYFEVAIENDSVVDVRKVASITNPPNTLTFNFMKMDDGKSMMLWVENPLARSVKYHIDMVDHRGTLYNTSSCPVQAGLRVFESWPHPISEIRITNFHFASKTEDQVCVY